MPRSDSARPIAARLSGSGRADLERCERPIGLVELAEIERGEPGRLGPQAGERATRARDSARFFVARARDEQPRIGTRDLGVIGMRRSRAPRACAPRRRDHRRAGSARDRELHLDRICAIALGGTCQLDRLGIRTEARRCARRDHAGARGDRGRRATRRGRERTSGIHGCGARARDRDRTGRRGCDHAQRQCTRSIRAAVREQGVGDIARGTREVVVELRMAEQPCARVERRRHPTAAECAMGELAQLVAGDILDGYHRCAVDRDLSSVAPRKPRALELARIGEARFSFEDAEDLGERDPAAERGDREREATCAWTDRGELACANFCETGGRPRSPHDRKWIGLVRQ